MSGRLHHTSFVLERRLPGSQSLAFRFWADHALKRSWNGCHPDCTVIEDTFDFRVGGAETMIWRMPDGTEQSFVAHFLDIARPDRIVYAYVMRTDGAHLSSSVVSVEFTPATGGSVMHYTEQAAFRDEATGNMRASGTGTGFDRLVAAMERDVG